MSEIDPNRPFANWAALMTYVRSHWELAATGDDGEWFEVVWEWSDDRRSQQVTFARVEHDGDVWVSWSSAIAGEAAMTDAQMVDATVIGRITREDGYCWLEQHIPLALLTPRLFDHYSDSFAERADNLELEITGADHE